MRDGTRIAVDVLLPEGLEAGRRVPAVVLQTRYVRGFDYRWPFGRFLRGRFDATAEEIVRHGYAWLMVDARGSGASFGTRPYPYAPDEVHDGEEVLDWIVAQPWSNGRVGAWGSSYDGGAALFLASRRHPALRAIMPRFVMFDAYAEGVFPGGLHLKWLTDTWGSLATALDKNAPHEFVGVKARVAVRGARPVTGDSDASLLRAAVAEHGGNGDVRALVDGIVYRDDPSPTHPELTLAAISPHACMDDINASGVAPYVVTSWLDASFVLSGIHLFLSSSHPHRKLTIGPWDHGAWNNISPFSAAQKPEFDHDGEALRFFDCHLKDVRTGILNEAPVHYFTMGEERWKSAATWPPPGAKPVRLYLAPEGRLTECPPSEAEAFDELVPDYGVGTGSRSRWDSLVNLDHGPIEYPDRAAQDARLPCYTTAPLDSPVEVTGHPMVEIYVSSTADDGSFFVYLEDIWPDGRVVYVTEGLLRAAFRDIPDSPPAYPSPVPIRRYLRSDARPLVAGEVARLPFDLYPISYRFDRGHRIRVVVANADADHFVPIPKRPPRLRYHRSRIHASHIELPVMGGGG